MEGKSVETQLEIAAQWLADAARQFGELRDNDYAQNCARVAEACRAVLKRAGRKC